MSYLVLARKHRPQTFDEVIGQEHITDLLKKAIQSDRLTHAFLFCGPRGIGKTSCARILAKSLNCEKGPTLIPCGQCPACQEIARGTSFDVLEIDGASNRGIDEIRTLRENVKFAPSYGRFKIYIVDEVHMLTTEAFNALLKTLEEPPAHVKFIFATTAPNKVPATIISRCQRYDFKRMPMKTIVELLSSVSKKEKLKVDQEALYAIGKAAQGSLRDALSILDQLSALSDAGGIGSEDVFSMLGLVETQLLFELTDAIGQKNCVLGLEVLEKIIDKGKDIKQLSRDIIEHFRHLMVIKAGGKSLGRLVDYPGVLKDMLLVQCQNFTLKEILIAIDTFIEAQETARITESARMPIEVALAKLTYRGEDAGMINEASAQPIVQSSVPAAKKAGAFSSPNVLRDIKGHVDISGSREAPEAKAADVSKAQGPVMACLPVGRVQDRDVSVAGEIGLVEEEPTIIFDLHRIRHAWDALTHAVSREKMSVATYLQEGVPVELTGKTLTVGFPLHCRFQKEALEDKHNVQLVERIFSEKLKTSVIVTYKMVEDCEPRPETKNVKDVLETFQGKVVSRWHKE